ncbi:MAG: 23S rRNA (adenine(2503)-C(2))-methyltransferase RlmN [Prevotellaceae bacterium]|jgi:23S rRNA (adenine2503-C2)-methyltransferase|nr:23S rRNA (adenine(2503)-C(2))-methyltransferase RlmN [Prevotellaceae bacterium]
MNVLFGMTPAELKSLAAKMKFPAYYGLQIAERLYKGDVTEIDAITNLSKRARAALAAEYETGIYPPSVTTVARDGTKKYLYRLHSGHAVESVYIPEAERATLCISSQAGCRMGCRFCMTARAGFKTNLAAGEILNQIRSLPERAALTNIVYMGMGEPMDNADEVLKSLEILTSDYGYAMSHKRITVSTGGVREGLPRFLRQSKCRLAISLHSPFDEERLQLMPMHRKFPIADIMKTIAADPFPQRRISFEYIMFAGVNDTERHARALVGLLSGINGCRVNLIRFHRIPDCSLSPSDETAIENFRAYLNSRGLPATVRASRGEDIFAACGMLAGQLEIKN